MTYQTCPREYILHHEWDGILITQYLVFRKVIADAPTNASSHSRKNLRSRSVVLDGDVPDGRETSHVIEALDDDGEEAHDQDEQLQDVRPNHRLQTALGRAVKDTACYFSPFSDSVTAQDFLYS